MSWKGWGAMMKIIILKQSHSSVEFELQSPTSQKHLTSAETKLINGSGWWQTLWWCCPECAKSSGWFSMNTQKMVVKHLVHINIQDQVHHNHGPWVPQLQLPSIFYISGFVRFCKRAITEIQTWGDVFSKWHFKRLSKVCVGNPIWRELGPKWPFWTENGSLIKVSKWFEIVPNDQYNLILSFRTILGLFGPVWTFSNKKVLLGQSALKEIINFCLKSNRV